MYPNCLFCPHSLDTNKVLSAMPVGREVAFQPGEQSGAGQCRLHRQPAVRIADR